MKRLQYGLIAFISICLLVWSVAVVRGCMIRSRHEATRSNTFAHDGGTP